jgi:hypothetical protein
MLEPSTIARARPRSKLTGLNPRTFTRKGKWYFGKDRRQRYVGQCGGSPDPAQCALIEDLISLEWSALAAEKLAENNNSVNLTAMRESREHRRLFQRLLGDFRKTLRVPSQSAPPESPPKPPTLADIVGKRRR